MKSLFASQRWRAFYRRHGITLWVLQAITLLVLGFLVARALTTGSSASSTVDANAASSVPAGQDDMIWTCSMHPQIRQPGPGKCPLCGMDLIPVAKSAGGLRTLTVSPDARALMQIETAPVQRRYVSHAVRMVGKVDYDETKFGYITAWVSGRLDRLYADYTGVQVRKGDHMAYIYSEELYAAQEELIQALKFQQQRTGGTTRLGINQVDLVESSREKLRLLGLTDDQIKEIEQQAKPSTHLMLYAPVGGVVIEKLKQEGERVKLGDRIYTIADLNLVWVHLDAYESDLTWIRYGQDVTITTEAYPGEQFHGRIAFIQPVLNDKTRTIKVRVNVPNLDGKLKPEMFVHATVHPMVAAGGRVMDPSLAGKWISPMHPEVVKDEPGTCDVCGMQLVRAETLGYVSAETDEQLPPLVVPYQAVLPTGTRAVVYVELPPMHSAAEPAFQTLATAVQGGDLQSIHQAFSQYSHMLDGPYDQPGTQYARGLWSGFADRLAQHSLAGQRVQTAKEGQEALAQLERIMIEAREKFAPIGQPTFEGREIVLGPRAGDYYLVRNGLEEGEMVVRQGNFKIDSEVQIQAKPSMMTPEGGGEAGGMHHHADSGGMAAEGQQHAEHAMTLPADFQQGLLQLYDAYDDVATSVQAADLGRITASFRQFGQILSQVDGAQLTGHPRMVWKELSMLLSNDAVEGGDVKLQDEADHTFLVLKQHMRRVRGQFSAVARAPRTMSPTAPRTVSRVVVAAEFQAELAAVWQRYLAVGAALASDQFQAARDAVNGLASAVAAADDQSLTDPEARSLWEKEQANLDKLLGQLAQSQDITAMRTAFRPLSDEVGFLAKAFGFGEAVAVYELHCPMAFENQGAVWYQADDQVRNPYFGAAMLSCADRVQRVVRDQPPAAESDQMQSQAPRGTGQPGDSQ